MEIQSKTVTRKEASQMISEAVGEDISVDRLRKSEKAFGFRRIKVLPGIVRYSRAEIIKFCENVKKRISEIA